MRKLAGTLSKFDTTAIFINQLREKIGVMFGSPETTPGGRALKFYSSVRLDVRKIENLKDGTEVVGSRTRVKVVKNKVAPPFRQCEFDIMYGKGISKEGSLIDVGVDLEIIKKSGAWFTYEGEQLGQGRENARAFLAEHTDIRDEIERKVREAVGLNGVRRRGRRAPIEIVPDVVLDDEPAADGKAKAKAKAGAKVAVASTPTVASGAGPARARTRRTATNGRSGSWRCALAARRELERRLARGRLRARRGRRRARAPRAGRPDRRRGLRASRWRSTSSPRGERAGERSRAPCSPRASTRRWPPGQPTTAPDDEQQRADDLAGRVRGGCAGVEPAKAFTRLYVAARPAWVRARGRARGGAGGPRDRRAGLGRWGLVSCAVRP